MTLVPPSPQEIDARLAEVERQRNNALNQCVLYAGMLAVLQERVKELETKLTFQTGGKHA
jgi:uncharacterized coiled-coil protein SlyX